jgi:hypothetical protein
MSQACLHCGACCANFRVSFYWAETTAHPDGQVPQEYTTPISPYHVAMQGTNQKNPRCCALKGEVGQQVSCQIYEQRSGTCREFQAGDAHCQAARARYG